MADEVLLGEITCPSGALVLVDAGYLGLWSGRRAGGPAVDFEVSGPDATAATRTFDRAAGRTLYDIPAHWATGFAAMFARHCRERGLDAALLACPRQVPYADRARRAIAAGELEFPLMGVPVVPVGGVPPDRPLRVTATLAEHGWHDLVVTLGGASDDGGADGGGGAAPVTWRGHGGVGVDNARLALADAEALGAWVHDDPLDGRADVVVRGPDAAEAAAAFAPQASYGTGDEAAVLPHGAGRGWLDVPFAQAAARALALAEYADRHPDRRFAVDLRPHSHEWQVMSRVRASPVEAATLEVGGATMLVAMTTAGDGTFPVRVGYDSGGTPVQIRVTVRPQAGRAQA